MLFIFTLFWTVAIDLLSKKMASLHFIERLIIVKDFLYIQYVENDGIAFSINIPHIKIATIFLIIMITYFYFIEERKKREPVIDLAFWLIIWWAIWNWIERVLNWKVIDFIWVNGFSVMNMADIFISLWAIIYITKIILFNKG